MSKKEAPHYYKIKTFYNSEALLWLNHGNILSPFTNKIEFW